MEMKPANHIYPQSFHGALSSEQIKQWRYEGYLALDNVIPKTLALEAQQQLLQAFNKRTLSNEGLGGFEFPSTLGAINDVTLHPNLIKVTKQLLGTDSIRLTQSDAWAKRGIRKDSKTWNTRPETANFDQRIHCDYPNHTFVHPPHFDSPPDVVSYIVYYSKVDDCGGATALVSRSTAEQAGIDVSMPINQLPGVGDMRWINDREMAEEAMVEHQPKVAAIRQKLYDSEKYLQYNVGTILMYRHDVWHRGTMIKENALRFVHNLSFRRADAEWVYNWCAGWARDIYTLGRPNRNLERLIASLSVEQRTVLGFPSPSSRYWTEYTLEAVRVRYAPFGFDMQPYLDAYRLSKDKNIRGQVAQASHL